MERRERFALLLAVLIIVGLPASVLIYQYRLRPQLASTEVIDIEAVVPEEGGFLPDAIEVEVGKPVTLRFASQDVTHGVAIGPGLNIDLGHVDPGTVKEITLTFDHPGVYTYYCNSWCSPEHWRMRGTIQVIDPNNPDAVTAPQSDPVIEALVAEGVDIDANVHAQEEEHHPNTEVLLAQQPSSDRGAQITSRLVLPEEVRHSAWQRSHTPQEALELLMSQNPDVSKNDMADVVAYLWTSDQVPEAAETLYNKNCAACHGQNGNADGPVAEMTAQKPAAFGDVNYMFQMRSDVLYAKIRRGGMGTDMPNFGTLFTPEETWALVRYLWELAIPAR